MSLSNNILQKIDHFVVVMLENRSFDHMLGFLYTEQGNKSPLGHPFEGLTGNESNPDESGNEIKVFPIQETVPDGYFMPKANPGEGFIATNEQLFEKFTVPSKAKPTNNGFVKDFAYTLGWEKKSGWCILSNTKPSDIMGIFTPKMLPILSTLAKSYAVCDHWYSSAPTETFPNRAFTVMGTSQGTLDDKTKFYHAPSIFKLLEKNNKSWAVYGYESKPLTRGSVADIHTSSNDHFGEFEDFKNAVVQGKLANFVFLEPNWGVDGNSQHPNYDVSKGEKFLYEIYNTLRNSKLWEKTLLIITYDEHGGCYDHVAPPENATPPDNCVGKYGFDFTRFGLRVPTVVVSPWIKAGTVFRAHSNNDHPLPTPFDHTSILSTLEKRFDMQPLTERDAAAPDLEDVLTLNIPREDNPMNDVTPPLGPASDKCECKPTHLQQAHAEILSNISATNKKGEGYHNTMPDFATGKEIESYICKRYSECFEDK